MNYRCTKMIIYKIVLLVLKIRNASHNDTFITLEAIEDYLLSGPQTMVSESLVWKSTMHIHISLPISLHEYAYICATTIPVKTNWPLLMGSLADTVTLVNHVHPKFWEPLTSMKYRMFPLFYIIMEVLKMLLWRYVKTQG